MFHLFEKIEGKVSLPKQFTFPFCYSPHPLTKRAADIVIQYLLQKIEWKEELSKGKMFGVLIVKDESSRLGFLAAFSGQIAGSYLHDYFVPPIYDLNSPDSFFKEEENRITATNHYFSLHVSLMLKHSKEELEQAKELYQSKRKSLNDELLQFKKKRDQVRREGVTQEEEERLIRESQFQKADAKRRLRETKEHLDQCNRRYEELQKSVNDLRKKRKELSQKLQRRLFEQFVFFNGKGEQCSLLSLFPQEMPPSGAGECCAPKMLQYAYLHKLNPICMGEFWWGESPIGVVRRHGYFYPSCEAKCRPILRFMLQGLDVEEDPLKSKKWVFEDLEIVYEDDYLWAINKPSGLLSVRGGTDAMSVESLFLEKFGVEHVHVIHRLDMATSGILLIAKSEDMYVCMQKIFAKREVKKRYLALLEGRLKSLVGTISLPLRADYEQRPYQVVDYEHGKPSETYFEVISESDGRTKVWFYPATGRTHQLRVHASHPQGLNAPIVGDELYGKRDNRLYLQAQRIDFVHPFTHSRVVIELPQDF